MKSILDQPAAHKRPSVPTSTLLVIFGFLFVVGVLWGPFGLKPSGILEEWPRLVAADKNNAAFANLGSGARPLSNPTRYVLSRLTPGTTIGLDLSILFSFFFKGLMTYGIVRILMPQNPAAAFVIGVLFVLYPADPEPFTMRSAGNQHSLALYMLAIYLLLANYKNPSLTRYRLMVVALVLSVLLYEVTYTTAFLAPLLLIWLDKGITKRVMQVAAVWYAALAVCFVYALAYFIEALSSPTSYISSNSSIGEKSFLDLLSTIVNSTAAAYDRHFRDGWLEAAEYLKPVTTYHYYALVLAFVVGLITFYLYRRSSFQSSRRYGFLLILGLVTLGLNFAPYAVTSYTWRIYYRSAVGAALSLVVVVLILLRLIPGDRIRKSLFLMFTVTAVYVAGLWSLFEHEDLMLRTLSQQDALSDIAKQAPGVKDDTVFILIADRYYDPRVGLPEIWDKPLMVLYNNTTILFEICLPPEPVGGTNSLARSKYMPCEFGSGTVSGQMKQGQNSTIIDRSFEYPYEQVLLFQLHWPDDIELLETVPSDYISGEPPTTYRPDNLIDQHAEAPARAQVLFLDWPVEEPLCDDTPVPLVNCNNYKVKLDSERADAYLFKGERELAVESLTRAISYSPDDAQLYIRRGNIYYQQRAWKQAAADYSSALDINPDIPDLYERRGFSYYQQRAWKQAAADFSQALKFNPDNDILLVRRGDSYYRQKSWAQAAADFSQAINIDPNNATLYVHRGKAYEKQQQADLAAHDYTRAIELDPAYAEAYLQRGTLYYDRQQFELALADYQRYVELSHEEADTEIVALINEIEVMLDQD